MLNIRFKDSQQTLFKVLFSLTNGTIKLIGDIPKNTSGFQVYRENGDCLGDYFEYTTIYKELSNGYQFSADGSVEPEVIVPVIAEPVIVEPTAEELEEQEKKAKIIDLNNQIVAIDFEFSALDYIGIKIATGRATTEDYVKEIARMEELATEKDRLLSQLQEKEN